MFAVNVAQTEAGSLVTSGASPNGVTLYVNDPMFSIGVQTPDGEQPSCTLTFQGNSVQMGFLSSMDTCIYSWPEALPAGSYDATISVSVSAGSDSTSTLDFTVAGDATALSPAMDLDSYHFVRFADYARIAEGLPPLLLNVGLPSAAQSHAAYLEHNWTAYRSATSLDLEPDATAAGFTGGTSTERAQAFGAIAPGGVTEILTHESLEGSMLSIMGSLFQRLALLDPRVIGLGTGYADTPNHPTYVLDLALASGVQNTPLSWAYPLDKATDIQTGYYGETPDPLAQYPAAQSATPEAGYPVSLTFNPQFVQSVDVSSATLSANGQDIPVYRFDGGAYTGPDPYPNGDVATTIAMFPESRLAYSTGYTAHITGTLQMRDGSTQPFDQSWSFTTETPPQATLAWQDGNYLFVTGKGLLGADISVAQASTGDASTPLETVYRDPYIVAFHVSPGELVSTINLGTNGSTSATEVAVQLPPLGDTGLSASSALAVNLAWARGLVGGYPNGTFQSDATITDAQAITMLYHSLGAPNTSGGNTARIAGVPSWAQAAVAWAVSAGVVQSSDGFTSDSNATRAQLITWLMRARNEPAADFAPDFKDASTIPSAFAPYVATAQDLGLASGFADGTFRPNAPVTRGAFTVWLVDATLPVDPELL